MPVGNWEHPAPLVAAMVEPVTDRNERSTLDKHKREQAASSTPKSSGGRTMRRIALLNTLLFLGFAMAQQDVRYFLNGMLLEIKNKSLRTVTTDGHRLATCVVPLDQDIPLTQVIIPRKAVLEMLRFIAS